MKIDVQAEALAIRRGAKKLKEIPQKHRGAVALALNDGKALNQYARDQATPPSRIFNREHVRNIHFV